MSGNLKETVEHEDDGDTNSSWYTWNGSQSLVKKTGVIGNQTKNRYHRDHSIVMLYENI